MCGIKETQFYQTASAWLENKQEFVSEHKLHIREYFKHRDILTGLFYTCVVGTAFATLVCNKPLLGLSYACLNYTGYTLFDETFHHVPKDSDEDKAYFIFTRGLTTLVTSALIQTIFKINFISKGMIWNTIPQEYVGLAILTSFGAYYRNPCAEYFYKACDGETCHLWSN